MSDRHVINLSAAWVPPDPAGGRATWLRRFGGPKGLGPGDRVWLTVDSAVGCRLELDGEPLPAVAAGAALRYDITERLRPRHELVLEPAGGGLEAAKAGRLTLPVRIGRVRLEILSAGLAGGPGS